MWSAVVEPFRRLPLALKPVAGGVVFLAPLIPLLIGAAALLTYLTLGPNDAGRTFGISSAIAFPTVAVCVFLAGRATSVSRANGGSYRRLLARISSIEARIEALSDECKETHNVGEAQRYLDAANTALLDETSLQWVLGTGYISAWQATHHAEELIIGVETLDAVLNRGIHDRLRVKNSEIPQRHELGDMLDTAIPILQKAVRAPENLTEPTLSRWVLNALSIVANADAAKRNASVATEEHEPDQATQATPADQSASSTDAPPTEADIQAARAGVSQVRRTVNEFRDERWEGLVRARNLSNTASLMLASFVVMILVVAVLDNVDKSLVIAATAFYLTGVVTGLFNFIYLENKSERTIDDYGLSFARLARTLIGSGIAGIGGVVLFAMLPSVSDALTAGATTTATASATGAAAASVAASDSRSLVAVATVQPTSAAATTAADGNTVQRAAPPALREVFDLDNNPFKIVVAGIFGVTPELLLFALQRQGDKLKGDLKSTAPGEGAKV